MNVLNTLIWHNLGKYIGSGGNIDFNTGIELFTEFVMSQTLITLALS